MISVSPVFLLRSLCGAARRGHRLGSILLAIVAIGGLELAAGCATEPPSAHPSDTTKYTLEDTDRFALIDGAADHAISCTGLMEVPQADGRMEVVANIKSREAQQVNVQASCVFRDANGIVVEETPWQNVGLPANATLAVRFIAATATTKNYTVRLRDAR